VGVEHSVAGRIVPPWRKGVLEAAHGAHRTQLFPTLEPLFEGGELVLCGRAACLGLDGLLEAVELFVDARCRGKTHCGRSPSDDETHRIKCHELTCRERAFFNYTRIGSRG